MKVLAVSRLAPEDVLSLISGGFDSGVSSYMLMRRGCRVHYRFNLGGAAHEIGVRRGALPVEPLGSSHRVRFVAINFEPVVGERFPELTTARWAWCSKRMMVRAASKSGGTLRRTGVGDRRSAGPVSSQTLTNLRFDR